MLLSSSNLMHTKQWSDLVRVLEVRICIVQSVFEETDSYQISQLRLSKTHSMTLRRYCQKR